MARKGAQSKTEGDVDLIKAEAEMPETGSETEPMDFDVWFTLQMAEDSKLQPWQRKQVRAFMGSHGLSEQEPKIRFDKAFKRF